MEERITREAFYPHPLQEVWHAISDQKAISEWFIKAEFVAEEGQPYSFRHEGTQITGEVLEVDPPHVLAYTWVVGGTKAVTTVRWELESRGDGTQLKLEHWGFADYGDSAPHMFANFSKGWEQCLGELTAYLAGRPTAST